MKITEAIPYADSWSKDENVKNTVGGEVLRALLRAIANRDKAILKLVHRLNK